MQARFEKYELIFKQASGTSRGVLKTKTTYFIHLDDEGLKSVGEAALFRGLSADDVPNYEEKLQEVCDNIETYANDYHESLKDFPSIVFGLEQAFSRMQNGSSICFENSFSRGERGIPINGLIWMGDEAFILEQIEAKLNEGFRCLKMKIGSIAFDKELAILHSLRKRFTLEQLEIRVDANGAFAPADALNYLERLNELDLHSIEQPIQQGQWGAMAKLCEQSPLDIALDEELIGIHDLDEKTRLLAHIRPQYIILKPALVGGFQSCDEWISLAESHGISWWITSALESNVGLEAIAQYTASKNADRYQGLGTGQLFTNNKPSNLEIFHAALWQNRKD